MTLTIEKKLKTLNKEFENSFDHLMRSVINSPEDDEWFYPALKELIEKYGDDEVLEFANSKSSSIYIISILIKAGFKGIDESLMLEYLNKNDEDEVYDAAISLAIYGHPLGFENLYKFADECHELSKNIIPKLDIIEDLKFINHPEAKKIEAHIKNKYPDITIE